MNTQKGFSTILLIAIGLLFIGGSSYYFLNTNNEKSSNSFIEGNSQEESLISDEQKTTDEVVDTAGTVSQTESDEYPEGKPVVESISPATGSIGTEIVIAGDELAGFEGDLIVIFERSDGKTISLWDEGRNYQKNGGNKIEVTIDEPCEPDEVVRGEYSGIPSECDYVEFTPGIYKVYVEPWGKRSNEVTFTLTDSEIEDNYINYFNEEYGFSIEYPENMEISYEEDRTCGIDENPCSLLGINFQEDDENKWKYQANPILYIIDDISIDNYVDSLKDNIYSEPPILEDTIVELNGSLFRYLLVNTDVGIEYDYYLIENNGKLFVFYAPDYDIFNKTLRSLRLE